MNHPGPAPSAPLSRREFFQAGAASALVGAAVPAAGAATGTRRGIIAEENAREGSRDWQLTRVKVDREGFRSPAVEGYCSRQSVRVGDTIEFMLSANPPRKVRLEIFRTGYYGGRGARKMTELGPLTVGTQPTPKPAEKNLHECRWPAAASLVIPGDWVSGVYLGLARYLKAEVTLIRVIALALLFVTGGSAALVYAVFAALLPFTEIDPSCPPPGKIPAKLRVWIESIRQRISRAVQ